jgi:hypothetical protein
MRVWNLRIFATTEIKLISEIIFFRAVVYQAVKLYSGSGTRSLPEIRPNQIPHTGVPLRRSMISAKSPGARTYRQRIT